MSINATQVPQDSATGESTDPVGYTTTYDGQTFFWAPNQRRAFLDDGVAMGHVANEDSPRGNEEPSAGVVEDDNTSKKKYPHRHPGRA